MQALSKLLMQNGLNMFNSHHHQRNKKKGNRPKWFMVKKVFQT
ncbi:unnamed protein product [Brugia timori]|uniref:Mobile element protein n=1 Tax=Brugia timori TaxID=42155 RepID=A0A0R3QBP8_9BILA|nr:unnamed protein product [Brugia timori]